MKAEFLTPLRPEKLGGKWWKIVDPLIYVSAIDQSRITVPPGFVTDFASVPRLPLTYWLFGSRADAPAGIHDMLYRWGFTGRIMADRIFNEGMKVDGDWLITRWPMTGAVMAGGWLSYKNLPGCLDYRFAKRCGMACGLCDLYYADWRSCYIKEEL